MGIRQFHRIAGLIFAPLFILVAVTGILLLWRKSGIYEKPVKEYLIGLHTWEAGAEYIGIILGIGLICLSVTGLILLMQAEKNKRL